MSARKTFRGAVPALAGGLALGGLVLASPLLHLPPLWTAPLAPAAQAQAALGLVVHQVEIEGLDNTPQEALAAAIGDVLGTPAAAIDLAAMRQRIESISWVRRASVTRRLPDRLVVHLEERRPFALWQHARKLHLVDRDGVLLTDTDLARWRSLPLLVGEGAPAAAPALLDALSETPAIATAVEAAIRLGERRWDLKLKSGLVVKLPEDGKRDWGLVDSLRRLAALAQRERLLERAVIVIDLRLPDRLVLRLPPGIRPRPLEDEQRT